MDDNIFITNQEAEKDGYPENTLRKPGITSVCLLYSIVVIAFLIIGPKVQHREFYSGILITEFLLIALPPLVMLFTFKYDVKKVLRFNKVSILNLFIIFCIMVFAMPVVGMLNLVNLMIIRQIFGKIDIAQVPVGSTPLQLLLSILVIGASAGICEELLFRGTIQRGLERLGVWGSIIITALLFGLLHVDFQKLLGTALLGVLIGFIVYRTNSIFSGMFAHFTNNTIAVVVSYFGNIYAKAPQKDVSDIGLSAFANLSTEQIIVTVVLLAFLFVSFAGGLVGLLYALIRNSRGKSEKLEERVHKKGFVGIAAALPGVVLIGIIYVAQGIKLMGWSNAAIKGMLKILGW